MGNALPHHTCDLELSSLSHHLLQCQVKMGQNRPWKTQSSDRPKDPLYFRTMVFACHRAQRLYPTTHSLPHTLQGVSEATKCPGRSLPPTRQLHGAFSPSNHPHNLWRYHNRPVRGFHDGFLGVSALLLNPKTRIPAGGARTATRRSVHPPLVVSAKLSDRQNSAFPGMLSVIGVRHLRETQTSPAAAVLSAAQLGSRFFAFCHLKTSCRL